MLLSGSVSNNQITGIFYQAGHRDIQKGINFALWDWYFRGVSWREVMCTWSGIVESSTLISALYPAEDFMGDPLGIVLMCEMS